MKVGKTLPPIGQWLYLDADGSTSWCINRNDLYVCVCVEHKISWDFAELLSTIFILQTRMTLKQEVGSEWQYFVQILSFAANIVGSEIWFKHFASRKRLSGVLSWLISATPHGMLCSMSSMANCKIEFAYMSAACGKCFMPNLTCSAPIPQIIYQWWQNAFDGTFPS